MMKVNNGWLVDPTPFFPSPTPPPKVDDGKLKEVEERLCPYNEVI